MLVLGLNLFLGLELPSNDRIEQYDTQSLFSSSVLQLFFWQIITTAEVADVATYNF